MAWETSLKYSDVQSIKHWIDEKSPSTARAINHLTDDELSEAKSLLTLVTSNQDSYQLASRYSAEILDSRNKSGYIRGKHISDALFQEMRFRAFLVMMNPGNDPADYHELQSDICRQLLSGSDGQNINLVAPVTWLAMIPVFVGILLLMTPLS